MIISASQAQVKKWSSLQNKHSRHEFGCYLVEGSRTVTEYATNPSRIQKVIASEKFITQNPELIASYDQIMDQVLSVNEIQLKKITQTVAPSGICAIISIPKYEYKDIFTQSYLPLFENISDPGNLGTIIRTADWYGLNHILLAGDCVDQFNPKVVRSALGALSRVQVHHVSETDEFFNDLNQQHYTVVGTVVEGGKLDVTQGKICLVFGSEAHGISLLMRNYIEYYYSIPGAGRGESLNLGVAFGIATNSFLKF